MIYKKSLSKRIFDYSNYTFLILVSLTCILPFFHLLAISLSRSEFVNAGDVLLWPVGFTTNAYNLILESDRFIRSFNIAVVRVILGVSINIILIVITAYPLSKSSISFKSRTIYAWFFVVSMLFTPSLIPSYLVVLKLGLMDSIWALILPSALQTFSMIVMLNFFRNLPKELEEAAFMDGASHWRILTKVYIPLSLPSIATVALFSIVFHWNSWFDGLIYMGNPKGYPLQSYLQTMIVNPVALNEMIRSNPDAGKLMMTLNNTTLKAAQLFLATIPVLIVYPFLQKYFTTGLVLGSVKE